MQNLRLLALALVVSLSFVSTVEARTLKVGHVLSADHPVHKGLEHFAKLVEEGSNGSLTIRIYPNGQLGTQQEVIERMQSGLADMAMANVSSMQAFSPLYGVFTQPYLFSGRDQAWKVLSGDVGKEILNSSSKNGIKGLAWFDNGTRSLYCTKAIHKPADLAGLKVRVQASPTTIEMIDRFGGSPTPIPWGELYSALQQGVVDCAENNITALTLAKHGEVTKFYSLTEHSQVPDVMVMSAKVFDGLTQDEQKVIEHAAADTMKYFWDLWGAELDKAAVDAKAMGVEIIPVDKKAFSDLVLPMHAAAGKQNPEIGDLITRINAVK